jgi:Haem-binding domain/Cytochrome P460
MKRFAICVLSGIVAFGMLQLVRPSIPSEPLTAEIQIPPEVRHVLEKNCYSCHSDQRRLAWFDEVVPAYWLVRSDILTAREHLNFSTLGSRPAAVQRAALYEAVNMIRLGAMPLPSFKMLHPEANVTPEEVAILKNYLAPWNPAPLQSADATGARGAPANPSAATPAPKPIVLTAVQPEFNGVAFDSSFEGWKLLSTTDRGDNNTFRFILGNDIAVKAVQSGNIKPWPVGTRFAKIAWQKELGPDGFVHPGRFVQVELMLKDARKHKDTEGWGWGRWRGLDLKPYGKDAHFVNECTSCHLPVHGNDYVYTLPITTAKVNGDEIVNNEAAALPPGLPYQPLGWNAITMYVDPGTHTTATVFGNDIAMRTVHSHAPRPSVTAGYDYAPGALLALVTWAHRDDPHWFGGRVPQRFQAVELVQVNASKTTTYLRYNDVGQLQDQTGTETALRRTNFMLGLAPAQLP